jgi:hypothetical protein
LVDLNYVISSPAFDLELLILPKPDVVDVVASVISTNDSLDILQNNLLTVLVIIRKRDAVSDDYVNRQRPSKIDDILTGASVDRNRSIGDVV